MLAPLKFKKCNFLFYHFLCSFYLIFLCTCSQKPSDLFVVQVVFVLFSYDLFPAHPIIFKRLPIYKRFTYASFTYALARALGYIVTSFTFVYATELLGYYGLWIIMIPTSIMYILALKHFEELEYEEKHKLLPAQNGSLINI